MSRKNWGGEKNLLSELVSIIIPCYNGEKYLEEAFRSILRQHYTNLEVIIVNDGSEDGSEQLILTYRKILLERGTEVIYIKQDNQGAAAAVKNALKYVNGKYIMLFDVDDILFANNVYEKVHFLEKNPEYSMVCNNGYYINSIHKIGTNLFSNKKEPWNLSCTFEELLLGKAVNWPGSYMVRWEEFYQATKGDIYTSRFGQNLQIMLPMAYKGNVGYIQRPLMEYYVHSDSHSHNGDEESRKARGRGYLQNHIEILGTMKLPEKEYREYIEIANQSMATQIPNRSIVYLSKIERILYNFLEFIKLLCQNEKGYLLSDRESSSKRTD